MQTEKTTGKLMGVEQKDLRTVARIYIEGAPRFFSSFDKKLLPILQALINQTIDVEYTTTVKDNYTYNNIVDIQKHEGTEEIQPHFAPATEALTFEERRERKIVRQSCLKMAIDIELANKDPNKTREENKITPTSVIETAKKLEAWVNEVR